MVFDRHPANPILTRADIHGPAPDWDDVSSVFNPGAIREPDGTVHLVLRVQNRGRETALFHATSEDGVHFTIDPAPIRLIGHEDDQAAAFHLYDPRLTRIEDSIYMMLAADLDNGCRLALAATKDWEAWDFHGFVSVDDNRNGVLFPETFAGHYLRLDRPNESGPSYDPSTGDAICLSSSETLLHWTYRSAGGGYDPLRCEKPVLHGRPHYWDERIGAGPPPLKTRDGWLLVYHGVATHFASVNLYQAGAALLDLDDPRIVLARSRLNLLEPRELYETVGQVPNVVFPSGLVAWDVDGEGVARDDSRLSLYYGAADTCVGLAESTVARVIAALEPE